MINGAFGCNQVRKTVRAMQGASRRVGVPLQVDQESPSSEGKSGCPRSSGNAKRQIDPFCSRSRPAWSWIFLQRRIQLTSNSGDAAVKKESPGPPWDEPFRDISPGINGMVIARSWMGGNKNVRLCRTKCFETYVFFMSGTSHKSSGEVPCVW